MEDEDFKQLFRKLSTGYWLSPQKAKELLKKILNHLKQNQEKGDKEL